MPNRRFLRLLTVAAALLAPGAAMAATAVATTNVNLRAGPSTAYPAVNVVRAGGDVEVFGCLSNRSWCDVDYYGQRGWMSSNYLAYVRGGQRYTGERVVRYIDAPVVSFSFGRYWDDHYRSRPFYRDRQRWDGVYGPPIFDRPPPPRRDFRDGPPPPPPYAAREGWRDREDRRDRREWRDERREDRRERREERRDRAEERGDPRWMRADERRFERGGFED